MAPIAVRVRIGVLRHVNSDARAPGLLNRPASSMRWVAFGVLAFCASVRAIEVTEWKNRQPLNVDAPGIISVAIPAETLDVARADLGDLRILDPAG